MLQLSIITPERTVWDGQIDQVTLTTTEGEITVLPHHIPLVSVLTPGELRMKTGDKEIPMAIAGGFVEVLPADGQVSGVSGQVSTTRVAVLADDALRVEDMDVAAIEAAQERARAALADKRAADDTSFADAAAALQKELARLRIARKYRRGSYGGSAPSVT
ncbi:MAG: ATP synthase F1 subunit epsilon [bacterium]|nr:ATP synthase F1 subunit epsilon [bacterium]